MTKATTITAMLEAVSRKLFAFAWFMSFRTEYVATGAYFTAS